MSPEEILRKLDAARKQQGERLQKLDAMVQGLRESHAKDDKAIQAMKLGNDFNEVLRRASGRVMPFHYMVQVPLPAGTTQQVVAPITIGADGWFIALDVWASWRITAGANTGRFMPLGSSDPTIATAAAPPADRLDYVWEYSEDRTGRARQNQGQTIPGDLMYRQDTHYHRLGSGDAWAPATTVTIKVTPTVAPVSAGTLWFTFLGDQCLQTGGDLLDQWISRKRELGI